MFLSQQHRDGVLTVSVTGRWLIENAAAISEELAAVEPGRDKVRIDTRALEDLDLTGAWCLHDWATRAQEASGEVEWQGKVPDQVRYIERCLSDPPKPEADEELDLVAPVRRLGRWAIRHSVSFKRGLAFFGEICSVMGSVPAALDASAAFADELGSDRPVRDSVSGTTEEVLVRIENQAHSHLSCCRLEKRADDIAVGQVLDGDRNGLAGLCGVDCGPQLSTNRSLRKEAQSHARLIALRGRKVGDLPSGGPAGKAGNLQLAVEERACHRAGET